MNTRAQSIEELRAQVKAKTLGEGSGSNGGDRAFYPFFSVGVGESCTLRFLPDQDENNPLPYVEKLTYSWEFTNPENPRETLVVVIPCIEMWGGVHSCPMAEELRSYFKAKTNTDIAKKLWMNRDYIYSGFVHDSPIKEEETPDNPQRIFVIKKRLHQKIEASILDTDPATRLDVNPVDFENGLDFIVKKTTTGDGHNDYHTQSTWARKSSPLTDDELAAIEEFDLWDLKSRLPAKPSDDAYAVAGQIFEAALSGGDWQEEWAETWKPYVRDGGGGGAKSHVSGGAAGARGRMARAADMVADNPPADENTQVPTTDVFEQAEQEAAAETAPKKNVKDTVAALRKRREAAAAS